MSNFPRVTRNRLYHLLSAFEEDLHENLREYVLAHLDEVEALGEYYEDALKSQQNDATGHDVAYYVNLGPTFNILQKHRREIPQVLADDVRQLASTFSNLVKIRNRVAHPTRPLMETDPEDAWEILSILESRFWKQTIAARIQLAEDPEFNPDIESEFGIGETRLSNLAPAEYDETGLIGREKEVKELTRLLKNRRYPIVTITGEGGLGKTALATEVAHTLLESQDSPFECILYVTLKTERLTGHGIQKIADAIVSVSDAEQSLAHFVTETELAPKGSQLFDFLEAVATLIVIDNLETVSGEEVLAFVESMPDSVNYLMTSRVGLGQVERRYPLEPLSAKDAAYLFRKLAAQRKISSLSGLSDSTVEATVSNLRANPLSIRWYIQSCEKGHAPLETLRNQTELLKFCVGTVFDAMSDEARRVLNILRLLNRPVNVSELSLYFPDVEYDEIRRWAQELSSASLAKYDTSTNSGIANALVLSETAVQFMPAVPSDAAFADFVFRIESEYRKSNEEAIKDSSYGLWSATSVSIRDENDEPAAYYLRLALSFSKVKNFDKALSHILKARTLAPDYWEVDRLQAYVLSSKGDLAAATALYRDAMTKSPDDSNRAITSYYLAGHLIYKVSDLAQAEVFSRQAYELSQGNASAALQLANCLTFLNRFPEAQTRFHEAALSPHAEIRNKATAGLVDSLRREALLLLDRKNVDEATEQALEAFTTGYEYWLENRNVADRKLVSVTTDSLAVVFQAASRMNTDSPDLAMRIANLYQQVDDPKKPFKASEKWFYVQRNLSLFRGVISRADIAVPSALNSSNHEDSMDHLGQVRKWDRERGFGFIVSPSLQEDVYFTKSAVGFKDDLSDLKVDCSVYFGDVLTEEKGPRAHRVILVR